MTVRSIKRKSRHTQKSIWDTKSYWKRSSWVDVKLQTSKRKKVSMYIVFSFADSFQMVIYDILLGKSWNIHCECFLILLRASGEFLHNFSQFFTVFHFLLIRNWRFFAFNNLKILKFLHHQHSILTSLLIRLSVMKVENLFHLKTLINKSIRIISTTKTQVASKWKKMIWYYCIDGSFLIFFLPIKHWRDFHQYLDLARGRAKSRKYNNRKFWRFTWYYLRCECWRY